jgi:hypothetical protein
MAGAEVVACVIELIFPGGHAQLEPEEVFSLISY